MIYGNGIDIIEIERIKKAFEKWGFYFYRRIFTPREIQYCKSKRNPYSHFAARFAAKEALIKALSLNGQSGIKLTEIEIATADGESKPEIYLHGKTRKIAQNLGIEKIFLSLSHSDHYAVAQVILEKRVLPRKESPSR